MAKKSIIVIGKRFGKLVILKEISEDVKRRSFSVRCDCGRVKTVMLISLVSGNTRSCGCTRNVGAQNSRVLVHGVGRKGHHLSKRDGKNLKSYIVWYSMLSRCYSPKHHKRQPTYIGCTVHDDWLEYGNFLKWFDANYTEGYQLDKDLRVLGNKIYSEDTCVFIPQHINKFISCSSSNGLPVGVCLSANGKRYRCHVSDCLSGKQVSSTFDTVEEAHNYWVSAKRELASKLAATLEDKWLADLLLNFKF